MQTDATAHGAQDSFSLHSLIPASTPPPSASRRGMARLTGNAFARRHPLLVSYAFGWCVRSADAPGSDARADVCVYRAVTIVLW